MFTKMHDNEIDIDLSLVQQLINVQFPQWAHLLISPIQSMGTDHAIYRLGTDRCIRLPRTSSATSHLEIEQKWLPRFAPFLPLAIPVPLAQGKPQGNYPYHWTIYQWLEGETISQVKTVDLKEVAVDLAKFLKALQAIDAVDAPHARRGVPLVAQANETFKVLESLHHIVDIDTEKLKVIWNRCLQAPVWNKPLVWVHGDLLPGNLLIQNGRLKAVIDFDSMGIGDPACDLLPAWSLFDKESRNIFRTALNVDDATWLRGQGWALSIAVIIIPYYYETNPELTAVAKRMLNELLAE